MIFWPLHILKFEILTVGNFKFEFFWIENFYWPLLYPIPKHGVLTMNTHWVSLNWSQGVVVGLLIKTTVIRTLTLRISPPNHEFSGLKSVFDSISTIRSISISFLLILFMIGVDDRSFHEDLISKMCLFIVIYLIVTFKSQRVTYVESS